MASRMPLLLARSSILVSPTSVLVKSSRNTIHHPRFSRDNLRKTTVRVLPHPSSGVQQEPFVDVPSNFVEVYPEFMPYPNLLSRNPVRERIERKDMLLRRERIVIPEFYVGSILAVTFTDEHAVGKVNRFVGICIDKGGHGLAAFMTLRNCIDGVEIKFEYYSPLIQSIETLRLEKRLDTSLTYLRDALPEYSTFPLDMEAEMFPEGAPVPVNEIKVKMKEGRWHRAWTKLDVKGIDFDEEQLKKFQEYVASKHKTFVFRKNAPPEWTKYDLMTQYRESIPDEEKQVVFKDLAKEYPKLKASERRHVRRK